jgi:hypothetical protein
LCAALCCVAAVGLSADAQNRPIEESDVKAAYLYNFAKFVEWPPEAFPSPSSPIVIVLLADSQFASAVEQAVAGKTAQGRPLEVRRVQQLSEEALQCHILFVSWSERGSIGDLLVLAKAAAVLTVSETEGFAQRGGTVNFVVSNNNVRFEVNNLKARTVGLKLSAKLLRLAASVWE